MRSIYLLSSIAYIMVFETRVDALGLGDHVMDVLSRLIHIRFLYYWEMNLQSLHPHCHIRLLNASFSKAAVGYLHVCMYRGTS